jgi:hypothetical protein
LVAAQDLHGQILDALDSAGDNPKLKDALNAANDALDQADQAIQDAGNSQAVQDAEDQAQKAVDQAQHAIDQATNGGYPVRSTSIARRSPPACSSLTRIAG